MKYLGILLAVLLWLLPGEAIAQTIHLDQVESITFNLRSSQPIEEPTPDPITEPDPIVEPGTEAIAQGLLDLWWMQ